MMNFSHLNFVFSLSKLLLLFVAPELQVPRERSVGWVLEWRMGISRLLDRVYAYMAVGALFFFQKLGPSTYLRFFLKLTTHSDLIIGSFIN
jgi:hypothetical protein